MFGVSSNDLPIDQVGKSKGLTPELAIDPDTGMVGKAGRSNNR